MVEVQKDAVTLEKGLASSYKTKLHLPSGPAFPLLGIYIGKRKTYIPQRICMRTFIAALFSITRNQVSISSKMDNIVNDHTGIILQQSTTQHLKQQTVDACNDGWFLKMLDWVKEVLYKRVHTI